MAHTAPAERARRAGRVRGWALGAAAAIAAWVGWLYVAPALGFPRTDPAGMIGRVLLARTAADSGIGWLVLVASLAAAATGFGVAATRGLFRPGPALGAAYGVALWIVTGAILMPLMGLVAPDPSSVPSMPGMAASGAADPMRGTFMMLHLGPLAPVNALIAWVVFGTVLGRTARRRGRTDFTPTVLPAGNESS